jgi:hypothetical protein
MTAQLDPDPLAMTARLVLDLRAMTVGANGAPAAHRALDLPAHARHALVDPLASAALATIVPSALDHRAVAPPAVDLPAADLPAAAHRAQDHRGVDHRAAVRAQDRPVADRVKADS